MRVLVIFIKLLNLFHFTTKLLTIRMSIAQYTFSSKMCLALLPCDLISFWANIKIIRHDKGSVLKSQFADLLVNEVKDKAPLLNQEMSVICMFH